MLARIHRFHGYNSLNWAYKHGETIHDHKLSLRYANNQRRHTYRAAVVISRKVNKSAVVRNRIRRRIYEAIQSNEDAIKGSYDLIFSVYSDELADISSKDLESMVKNILKRANVI